ncbi:hypothetical protein SAMN05444671_4000 [Flavobacterium sp. CF108]|uniref:hypothetical protein n=1 Tax=unclassified Flavobacterium TaxID=196869 RepID=UPI0008CFD469|nr:MULTISPECIES: hypothetical protein [unclassified Flavobacterium]SEO92679.1 hypothetical protein SAMN04487978_3972 [Flavobacterium sp. fv08]SHH84104.1 hypothetical protein SAMN05444671_4000 [Flavobacterium sp. CF108]
MKFPTTPEDLKNELFNSVDKINQVGDLRIRQLIQILPKVSDEIIIEGIIQVFEDENRVDSVYTDQKYAGIILKKLNPKTEESAASILSRTLKNWNKSVEELPFWMKDNYGIESVKQVFSELEKTNLTSLESEKLKTMKRFLGIKS